MNLGEDEYCGEACDKKAGWWFLTKYKTLFSFCDKHKKLCGALGIDENQLCDRDKIEKILLLKQI